MAQILRQCIWPLEREGKVKRGFSSPVFALVSEAMATTLLWSKLARPLVVPTSTRERWTVTLGPVPLSLQPRTVRLPVLLFSKCVLPLVSLLLCHLYY